MIIKTIDRYLLTRFIISLVVALGAIMLIALIVDLVENLERIVDNAPSVTDVIRYYIYFLPWIYKIIAPAAVLMAGLFSIGLMARNNEILAMKSSGISLYRIAAPLLVFAFLLSIFNLWFNEEVLPIATMERNRIKHGTVKKRRNDNGAILYNQSKQGEGGYIYHFDQLRTDRQEAKGCLVQRFERDSLVESYRGERMRYDRNHWVMYNGVYRNFSGELEKYEAFDSLTLVNCNERPEEFAKYKGKPEDMGYRELAEYINVLKKTGSTYTPEVVDLKAKISFPLTSFIVMFICIPLASNPKRSGVAMAFATASGISLLYFVVFKITQSLGHSGKLPPDLSAWLINGLFLTVGIIVFLRAHK